MNVAEAEKMVKAVEERRRAEHGLVQLPPCARHRARASNSLMRAASGRRFTTARRICRTGRSSPDVPQGGAALWRLDVNVAGSGVTGDLLAHSIDTAMWLNGPITRVVAKTETFVKERKHAVTGED